MEESGVCTCGGISGGTRRNEGSSVTVGESGEKPGVTRSRSLWGIRGGTQRNEGVGPVGEIAVATRRNEGVGPVGE